MSSAPLPALAPAPSPAWAPRDAPCLDVFVFTPNRFSSALASPDDAGEACGVRGDDVDAMRGLIAVSLSRGWGRSTSFIGAWRTAFRSILPGAATMAATLAMRRAVEDVPGAEPGLASLGACPAGSAVALSGASRLASLPPSSLDPLPAGATAVAAVTALWFIAADSAASLAAWVASRAAWRIADKRCCAAIPRPVLLPAYRRYSVSMRVCCATSTSTVLWRRKRWWRSWALKCT